MKNVLKHILTSVMVTMFFIGCATMKHQPKDATLGTSMKIAYVINEAKTYQIDSIVLADTLPSVDKWMLMNYLDYETNKRVLKRMYIRTYTNGSESTYIIVGNEEPYQITKRIIQ